jgi:predicted anti-sigma-YlaC factor YlaD
MNMQDKSDCDLIQLEAYLKNELTGDDLLNLLLHLDECKRCRTSLFQAMKGTHEHYYRKSPSKKLEKEMKELSKLGNENYSSDDDELTDVA